MIAGAAALVTAGRVFALGIPLERHPQHGSDLGEIFFLEALAADGRWTFLLVAPPLPVLRAVGTPINPYALK